MSVIILYRIRNDSPVARWMLPESNWYHGKMTFTTTESDGKVCTILETEDYLARSDCPVGSYHTAILPI